MARTLGALNKRTRIALSEAAEGEFKDGAEKTLRYLIKTATDTKREDSVRMQAANVLLPYLRPKLSAVENTNVDESRPEADILADLEAKLKDPKALEALLPGYSLVKTKEAIGFAVAAELK